MPLFIQFYETYSTVQLCCIIGVDMLRCEDVGCNIAANYSLDSKLIAHFQRCHDVMTTLRSAVAKGILLWSNGIRIYFLRLTISIEGTKIRFIYF